MEVSYILIMVVVTELAYVCQNLQSGHQKGVNFCYMQIICDVKNTCMK
jgi:hypothetical protein